MKEFLWYKTCPFCDHRGRLFVYKNTTHDKLYLHCEECERGYYDLEKINKENSFLTLTEDFEAIEATFDDIKKFNWEKYSFNILTE